MDGGYHVNRSGGDVDAHLSRSQAQVIPVGEPETAVHFSIFTLWGRSEVGSHQTGSLGIVSSILTGSTTTKDTIYATRTTRRIQKLPRAISSSSIRW